MGQHQEVPQLVLEECAAVFAARRKVEGQRGEGVQDAKPAGHAAEECLDADDADHHLGRHAIALLGRQEPVLVGAPEGHAGLDAPGLDEACAVGGPVLGGTSRRRHDQSGHRGHVAGLSQGLLDPVSIELVRVGDVVHPLRDVLAVQVRRRRRRGARGGARHWARSGLGRFDGGLGGQHADADQARGQHRCGTGRPAMNDGCSHAAIIGARPLHPMTAATRQARRQAGSQAARQRRRSQPYDLAAAALRHAASARSKRPFQSAPGSRRPVGP